MEPQTSVSREIIAQDFRNAMHGKMDKKMIDAVVTKLSATTAATTAAHFTTGSVHSFIFYLCFEVQIQKGKSFNGNAGGLAFPGEGMLMGNVYTDDLDKLYRETVSFEFQATPVYTSLLFFNDKSILLGHFQAGSVSLVTGVGGGTGSWH